MEFRVLWYGWASLRKIFLPIMSGKQPFPTGECSIGNHRCFRTSAWA